MCTFHRYFQQNISLDISLLWSNSVCKNKCKLTLVCQSQTVFFSSFSVLKFCTACINFYVQRKFVRSVSQNRDALLTFLIISIIISRSPVLCQIFTFEISSPWLKLKSMARLEVGWWKGQHITTITTIKKQIRRKLRGVARGSVVKGVVGIVPILTYQSGLQVCHLMLKLIEHILALVSRTIARTSTRRDYTSENIKLGPVSEDQVGESKKNSEDDSGPEEVDVGVDCQHAVLVEQPRQGSRGVLHFWDKLFVGEQFF